MAGYVYHVAGYAMLNVSTLSGHVLDIAVVWLVMQLPARWVVECWCIGSAMYAMYLAMQIIHL